MLIIDNFMDAETCARIIEYHKTIPNCEEDESHPFWKGRTWGLGGIEDDLAIELMCASNHFHRDLKIRAIPEEWQLVHWSPGQSMPFHGDYSQGRFPFRDWAVLIYLNDDYEGGQTYFFDGTEIQPKTGRIAFFKGGIVPHGVREVKGGSRWTAITWYRELGNGEHGK